ncbi:MAG TPA: glycine/sarcosine/betaine reductase component B subunit [Candidatus Acidoferrales bacterium]|nr:glycine/sarcosine/betaine reductase component B subunit [Candidatus Acidoferrales bacterium]
MELILAHHPITEIQFGPRTRLQGKVLVIDPEELRRLALEDAFIVDAGFEIVKSGESCRAGPVFDIIEPRAKAAGASPDFPGILGPPTTAGIGTTHVLVGAAVSVLSERGPGESRSATGRFLEMSGVAAEGTEYSSLQHLVVILHTRPGLPNQDIEKVYRRAGLKIAVRIASIALDQTPASTQTFAPAGPVEEEHAGLPRVAYIGQIFSRQRKPAVDEPILYGANTDGMLPVVLHPDEWLDGAIVPSLRSWIGGTETFYYQNHPVIMELYRRHHARELNFVGTVATIAGSDNLDRERNCRTAANLVKWALEANAVVLTKYGGGLPHADLAETARLLEGAGIKTAVMVSDTSRDRRVESALLFNFPEINAIVYNGGNGTKWEVPRVERIIAATPDMKKLLAGPFIADASDIIGVTNQQGASRMRAMVY